MPYIDNNDAYLGCCRQDKKCNVFVLPLYRLFYILSEEWSNWMLFKTYSSGYSPNKTFGQAVMSIKIHYIDAYKRYQSFAFSPFFLPGSKERLTSSKDYDPRNAGLSLRPGSYTATIDVKIRESFNNSDDRPYVVEYEEIVNFNVPESGTTVLTLFAAVGAKYRTYEKLRLDYTTTIEKELVENKLEHKSLVLDGEQARAYYKWWDNDNNLIKITPEGTPWGFTAPSAGTASVPKKPTAKPAAATKTAPKTTPPKKTSAIKPSSAATATKPISPAKTTSSAAAATKPASAAKTKAQPVVNSAIEEDYKKGERIYIKCSGKKKMFEAAKLMEAKADTGDVEACLLVLKAYTYAEKYANANKYIEPFIRSKKADVVYWFADKLEFVKGYGSRSKDLFLLAAENGIADAYEKVASFYYGQSGVLKDYNKVMEYYQKGANLGSAVCLWHLADIYRTGLGGLIKPNKAKYSEYLQKAADAGDSIAQYTLGCSYIKGKNGFPVDKKKANYWFEKSANNPQKPYSYAKLALQGDYSQIE